MAEARFFPFFRRSVSRRWRSSPSSSARATTFAAARAPSGSGLRTASTRARTPAAWSACLVSRCPYPRGTPTHPLPPRYPKPTPTPTVPKPSSRLLYGAPVSCPGGQEADLAQGLRDGAAGGRYGEMWGDVGRCGSGERKSNDFRPVVQARNGTRSSRHQPTRRTKCGAVGGTRRRRPSPARGNHGLPVPLRRPHRWRRRRRRGEARRARGQAAARGVGEGWARLGSPSSVGSASSLPYLPISPHKAHLDRRAVLVLQEPSRNLLGTF